MCNLGEGIWEDGLAEGREANLLELISKKLAKGKSVEQIADAMERCFTVQNASEFIVFYLQARLGTGKFMVQNLSGMGNTSLWYL